LRAAEVLEELRDRPAVSTDGVHIQTVGEIARREDMGKPLEQGAEGVGLLRTELLYDRDSRLGEERLNFIKGSLLRSGGLPSR